MDGGEENVLVPIRYLVVGGVCFPFDRLKFLQHFGHLKHKIHSFQVSRKCNAENPTSAVMSSEFQVSRKLGT